MILLDTSVLSAVLRRRRRGEPEQDLAVRVAALLRSEAPVGVPGIVLQEILSGIADRVAQLRILGGVRSGFPIVLATEGDHLGAADLVNLCARKGVAVSTRDALIAAQALNRRASLMTTDGDFLRLADLAGLRLAWLRPPATRHAGTEGLTLVACDPSAPAVPRRAGATIAILASAAMEARP